MQVQVLARTRPTAPARATAASSRRRRRGSGTTCSGRSGSSRRRGRAAGSRPRRDRPTETPQRSAARSPTSSITPSGSWPGISGNMPGPDQVAPVLLDVAAADPARLDPQQALVGADRRPRELLDLVRQSVLSVPRLEPSLKTSRTLPASSRPRKGDQRHRLGLLRRRRVAPVLGPRPAVDHEVAAGDQPRVVRAQPRHAVADVGRRRRAAIGMLPRTSILPDSRHHAGRSGGGWKCRRRPAGLAQLGQQLRVVRPWRRRRVGVDADPIRRQVHRGGAREVGQPALVERVGDHAGASLPRVRGQDVDDRRP